MPAETTVVAFICLLRDQDEARGLAQLLESLVRHRNVVRPLFLVPELRGGDFFTPTREHDQQIWRAVHVPPAARAVYLLCDEPGLDQLVGRAEGAVLVATAGGPNVYPQSTTVAASLPEAPFALAEAVINRFSGSEKHHPRLFDTRDIPLIAGVRRQVARTAEGATHAGAGLSSRVRMSRPQFPSLLDVEETGQPRASSIIAATADPLGLVVAETARLEANTPAWSVRRDHGREHAPAHVLRSRLPWLRARRRDDHAADARLTAMLLKRAPMLVVIGSRKGGVGKTSHAAGMAIVAGSILDGVGHRAAILDANVANPDAWGVLSLPKAAATVRDLAAALMNGEEPPEPIHATTPALACYPERRDGTEYARNDIRRMAQHLRTRYAFIVVDLSNRLPDPMGGPESAVAAFWLAEADGLVLPTASSRQDFNGVLDYLEVGGLPPTVVPCIASAARQVRRHPVTREYLAAISARVERVIEIPDEADSIRIAGMDGRAVQDVSPTMRLAYRALTEAVLSLPTRVRS